MTGKLQQCATNNTTKCKEPCVTVEFSRANRIKDIFVIFYTANRS